MIRFMSPYPTYPLTDASNESTPDKYSAVRKVASRLMSGERKGHTLQPTALAHEAILRLLRSRKHSGGSWEIGEVIREMRRVLIDHGRNRNRLKREGAFVRTEIPDLPGLFEGADNVLLIKDALQKLSTIDRRAALVVERHCFQGLSYAEIAVSLNVSTKTVTRDWSFARAWLHQHLTPNIKAF